MTEPFTEPFTELFTVIWSEESLKQVERIKKRKGKGQAEEYLKRIGALIRDIQEHPFTGKGKPEHLRYISPSCWSRRINRKDRLIYRVFNDQIQIVSILGHYDS